MKKTIYYNLKKPEGTDVVNIEDLNENADKIDKELKNVNDRVNNIKIPEAPVKSVNGKNGYVVLKSQDIKTNAGSTIEAELSNKVDKEIGKKLSTNDFTDECKSKLERLKINSDGTASTTQYVHPSTHPASMIVEDSSHRFVTDSQIEKWDDNKGKVESVNGMTGQVNINAHHILYENNGTVYQGVKSANNKVNVLEGKVDTVEKNLENIYDNMMMTLVDFNDLYSSADKTYYVNNESGNDSNDGLSKDKAFATIKKALGLIPTFINHKIRIILEKGDYDEPIELKSKFGSGDISIYGNKSTVKYINLNTVSVKTLVKEFDVKNSYNYDLNNANFSINFDSQVLINQSYYVVLIGINATASLEHCQGFSFMFNSVCHLKKCTFKNKLYGISNTCNSSCLLENCTGSSNVVALISSESSTISLLSSEVSGAFETFYGGVIDDKNAKNR